MRKTFVIAAAAIAVVLVAGYVAQAGTAHRRAATVIHVVERATTDLVIDTGPTGDSSGDLLTFANDLYDETNVDKVGRDQGSCIRINTTEGSWECTWINFLKGGAITVEGPVLRHARQRHGDHRRTRQVQGRPRKHGAEGAVRRKWLQLHLPRARVASSPSEAQAR